MATMLEYCKIILEKVSFSQPLFEKELKKSIGYLMPEEMEHLIHWAQTNFSDQYSDVINEIVKMIIK